VAHAFSCVSECCLYVYSLISFGLPVGYCLYLNHCVNFFWQCVVKQCFTYKLILWTDIMWSTRTCTCMHSGLSPERQEYEGGLCSLWFKLLNHCLFEFWVKNVVKNNLQHKTVGKLKATEKMEAWMSLSKHLKELKYCKTNCGWHMQSEE